MRKIISISILCLFALCSLYSAELWNGITSEMNENAVAEHLIEQFNAKLSKKESGDFKMPSHDEKGHPEKVDYEFFISEQEPFFISKSDSWLYDNDFIKNNINCLFWKNKIYCVFVSLDVSFTDVRKQMKKTYGKEKQFSGGYLAWENNDILIYGYPNGDDELGYYSQLIYINKSLRNDWIKEEEKRQEKIRLQEEKEKNKLKYALNFLKFDENTSSLWKEFTVDMSPEDCISTLKENYTIDEGYEIFRDNISLHYNPESDGIKNPPLTMYAYRVLNDYSFFDIETSYSTFITDEITGESRELKENIMFYFYENKLYAIEIRIQNEIYSDYIKAYCAPSKKFVKCVSPKYGSGVSPQYYKLKTKDVYYDIDQTSIIYIDSVARQKYVQEQKNQKKDNANKIKF